ncbi:MAG: hypothetical protein ABIR18_16155, partial [Chitinophagaceae bacterium]
MKKIVPLYFLLLISINLSAQEDCSDDKIMAVKGKWVKRPDATMSSGNQSAVTGRVDKMQQLFQAAYSDPKGMEVRWYRSMGGYYPSIN